MAISLKNIDDRVTVLENKIVNAGFMVPDWSTGTTFTSGTSKKFTATAGCLYVLIGYTSRSFCNLYINNKQIWQTYHDYGGYDVVPMYLNKGDVFHTSYDRDGIWFPLKAMNL